MVNLKAKPYYLADEDIAWVENTIAAMTDEEKDVVEFDGKEYGPEPAENDEHFKGVKRIAAIVYEAIVPYAGTG